MTEAYARLVGRKGKSTEDTEALDKYIMKLPCTIGRQKIPENGSEGEQIQVGQTATLSRYHAIINWNEETGIYEIECTSKNGFCVNNKPYSRREIAPLNSKSTIRVGSVKLIFTAAGNFKMDFYEPLTCQLHSSILIHRQ